MKKKGIGFYFKRIDEIMSMAANAHLKKYDITCSQANILFYMLEKGKNVVMQKEIEQEFGLRHSTIIGLLKRMEKNNFVRVEVNPEDHRCRQVILFDKAFELGSEMKEHRKYMDSLITGALNDEEEKELKKLLWKRLRFSMILKHISNYNIQRMDFGQNRQIILQTNFSEKE